MKKKHFPATWQLIGKELSFYNAFNIAWFIPETEHDQNEDIESFNYGLVIGQMPKSSSDQNR